MVELRYPLQTVGVTNQLLVGSFFWFLKDLQMLRTPTYPWSIPQASPNPQLERNSFINRWLKVWGMFQGYVGKFFEDVQGPSQRFSFFFQAKQIWGATGLVGSLMSSPLCSLDPALGTCLGISLVRSWCPEFAIGLGGWRRAHPKWVGLDGWFRSQPVKSSWNDLWSMKVMMDS